MRMGSHLQVLSRGLMGLANRHNVADIVLMCLVCFSILHPVRPTSHRPHVGREALRETRNAQVETGGNGMRPA